MQLLQWLENADGLSDDDRVRLALVVTQADDTACTTYMGMGERLRRHTMERAATSGKSPSAYQRLLAVGLTEAVRLL
jgi:hypothetical protein